MLLILIILVITVTFLNGFTDAPNSLANCVMTRCLSLYKATVMGGVCNLIGVVLSATYGSRVTKTIFEITNLSKSYKDNTVSLCCSLLSVIILATTAWYFAIPTSESHALLAALGGSTLAVTGKFNISSWSPVILGLFLSILLGAFGGFACCRLIERAFSSTSSKVANSILKSVQIVFALSSSILHGLQDGLKLTVFLQLGLPTLKKSYLIVGLTMALGTTLGGGRIMKSVGEGFARLKPYQGASADIATTFALAISTALGMPISTSNVKTAALCGTAASTGLRRVNWNTAISMVSAWVLTFPFCFILSYVLTHFIVHS